MTEETNVKPFLRRVETPKQDEINLHGIAEAAKRRAYVLGGDSPLTLQGVIDDIRENDHKTFLVVFVSAPKSVEDLIASAHQYRDFVTEIGDGRDYTEVREHLQHTLHAVTVLIDIEQQKFMMRLMYTHTPFGCSFGMSVHDGDANDLYQDNRYSTCGLLSI